jgi:hypothetical protein
VTTVHDRTRRAPSSDREQAAWWLLAAHVARSGLDQLTTPVRLRPWGVLELRPHGPASHVREALLSTGLWIEDPLPALRRRHKPWVVWSVRERRVGVALHVEQERDALVVHLDACNPGARALLYPLHALIDLVGWRRLRPRVLRFLARRLGDGPAPPPCTEEATDRRRSP